MCPFALSTWIQGSCRLESEIGRKWDSGQCDLERLILKKMARLWMMTQKQS